MVGKDKPTETTAVKGMAMVNDLIRNEEGGPLVAENLPSKGKAHKPQIYWELTVDRKEIAPEVLSVIILLSPDSCVCTYYPNFS